MNRKIGLVVVVTMLFLGGCASVPMESSDNSERAKRFGPPSNGSAGLYIYRSGSFGGVLKKDVWVDGKCIGETAPDVFFHEEVAGGVAHKVSTESEFSPNDVAFTAASGNNYFVRQYIKLGLLVGGAGLELVDEKKGQAEITKLKMAKKGTCSR